MRLIDDWHKSWRLLSVQANSIGVAICTTYAAMFEQLKDTIPPSYMAGITGAVFALGIIGRMVSQTPKVDE
jgi:hypothetical protein